MKMNYNPSTIGRIADIHSGIRVETGSLAAATYLLGAANTQTELFTVVGRVKVLTLYLEILTAVSAHACQVLFNCTFTTPVIAANAMCAKCASIASAAQGVRVWWLGGAVATAAVITDSAGLSDINVTPQIVGGKDFVGSIGILASDASLASGTFMGVVHYVPMSDGAYIEAKL
jgi:hypothetical protein